MAKFPKQVPYIIGNEACERFSFYGMRNILVPFLSSIMFLYMPVDDRAPAAKHVFHIFVMGVYFFPLIGGFVADRLLGKYRTIYALSLVYCVGHGLLAAFESNESGFYTGLFLIALGSGGIKPLVSSFVGDQFDKSNSHLAKVVFDIFYWSVNFGSFFASLIIPILLRDHGPSVAFGVPGVLMFLATLIFIAGKKKYVIVGPRGADPDSFLRVVVSALTKAPVLPAAQVGGIDATVQRRTLLARVVLGVGLAACVGSATLWSAIGDVPTLCLILVCILLFGGIAAAIALENAQGHHSGEAIEGVRAVLRILIVFAFVTPFWSLFDQKASTWVLQANAMTKPSWMVPAHMQMLNPALVMLLIPFNNIVLYPLLRKAGVAVTPLRRMGAGIFAASVAWVIVGFIQMAMDDGATLTIWWQILPYAFLTFGEVLVSATGLEFAYSQAPPSMKGTIMSFWNLAVTVGNLWVVMSDPAVKSSAINSLVVSSGLSRIAFLMFFFAGFAALAAVGFALYARNYKMTDNYRTAQASSSAS